MTMIKKILLILSIFVSFVIFIIACSILIDAGYVTDEIGEYPVGLLGNTRNTLYFSMALFALINFIFCSIFASISLFEKKS